jgi:hypothetical protein
MAFIAEQQYDPDDYGVRNASAMAVAISVLGEEIGLLRDALAEQRQRADESQRELTKARTGMTAAWSERDDALAELRKAHNAPAGTTPASLPLWQDVQRLLLHAGIATIRHDGAESWQVSDGSSTQHTAATLADAVWSFQAARLQGAERNAQNATAWEHEE